MKNYKIFLIILLTTAIAAGMVELLVTLFKAFDIPDEAGIALLIIAGFAPPVAGLLFARMIGVRLSYLLSFFIASFSSSAGTIGLIILHVFLEARESGEKFSFERDEHKAFLIIVLVALGIGSIVAIFFRNSDHKTKRTSSAAIDDPLTLSDKQDE